VTRDQSTLVAFAGAPLLPSLLMAAAITAQLQNPAWTLIAFLPALYLSTLVAEAVLAGPLIFLGLWLRRIYWWSSTLSGSFVGILVLLALQPSRLSDMSAVLAIMGTGGATGFAFWAIWRLGKAAAPGSGARQKAPV
jgi:hypothetical protein